MKPTKRPPQPLAKVRRLQNALRGLSKRTKDRAINVVADGLIGPHTVSATNRAMMTYAPQFAKGPLSRADVLRQAPQLAAWLEKAPYSASSMPASAAPFVAPPAPVVQPSVPASMPGGESDMPYPPNYYQQPGYPPAGYAPAGYGPPAGGYGPGGLPTDRASLDVRAFIPAQYEHFRLSPGTGTAIVVVGLVVVAALMRDKHKKHA